MHELNLHGTFESHDLVTNARYSWIAMELRAPRSICCPVHVFACKTTDVDRKRKSGKWRLRASGEILTVEIRKIPPQILYGLRTQSSINCTSILYDSNADGFGDFPGLIENSIIFKTLAQTASGFCRFIRHLCETMDTTSLITKKSILFTEAGMTSTDSLPKHTDGHSSRNRTRNQSHIRSTPVVRSIKASSSGSNKRNYYVWSDTDQIYKDARIIFCDTEKSNWTWDPVANAYYWHRFFSHQPDLNFDNPSVIHTIEKIMRSGSTWRRRLTA